MAHQGRYFKGEHGTRDKNRLLLVEGPDDAIFFDEILASLPAPADPNTTGIAIYSGTGGLDAFIEQLIKSPEYVKGNIHTYAVVRDADINAGTTLSATQNIFKKYNQAVPPRDSFAQSSPPNVIRTGLFILPPAGQSGDLEETCWGTISGITLATRVDTFLADTLKTEPTLDKLSKRKVQMYLANRLGHLARGAGMGFKENHFDRNHASLATVKSFCTQLIS
jgi:hypothetical protein